MKVAIDCDGTATKYPDFFVNLGRALKVAGHQVYVVTGIPRSVYFGKRLIKHPHLADDSWYNAVYTSDNYNENERELAKKVLAGEMDNVTLVGMFKQRICEELGVCVMFDDRATQQRSLGKIPMFEVA